MFTIQLVYIKEPVSLIVSQFFIFILFSDACQRLKEVLSVIEFFDDEEIDEADELREILNHYHIRSLMQVKRIKVEF